MKKLWTLTGALLLLATCAGCGSNPTPSQTSDPPKVEATAPKTPPAESVDWAVISVDAATFGMETSPETPLFSEVFGQPSQAPLDQLIAFTLIADGASEGASDELYHRFLDAPNTVLNYLALMGDQTVSQPGNGDVCAAEAICREIAAADVAWYDTTEEFQSLLKEYQGYYPSGRIAELLESLETEHDAAIQRNAAQ